MKKLAFALLSLTLMSCASTNHSGVGSSTTAGSARTPAANDLKVELQDVAALLKGYFSSGTKRNPSIQGYSAYIIQAPEGADFGRLVIYVDDADDPGKQKLIVDNNKFVNTGGPMAGDEPSLATNRKDSLLIQTGNDGSGRTIWRETVTVAWRDNQLVVAGFDYTDADRLGQSEERTCSVNFLTGKGLLTISPAREANPNGKIKTKPLTVPLTPLISDWADATRPAGCFLQLDR